jgi:hypothetical protein
LGIREIAVKPAEYEQLVAEIADGICQSASELQDLVIGSGHTNQIVGASGYPHQIDVSLQERGRLFIIECKRWKSRIGVAEVLVLAARASDIQSRFQEGSVTAVLVSMRGASAGAEQLARHFGVAVEIATSASEFGLRIGRFVHQAVADGLQMSDHCETSVMRKGVVINV